MKKIFKKVIYYFCGLIIFSLIAFISQRITISLLLQRNIDVYQDIMNISNYIITYSPYYIVTYTIIYYVLLFFISKYDRYIVNELNKKLEQGKNGGINND